MGRSILSFALVAAILLGLSGRVGAVIVHAHEGGCSEHQHADLGYVGHLAEPHGHEHDAPPAPPPNDDSDDSDPQHAHYAVGDGPIVRRGSLTSLPGLLVSDVVALGVVGSVEHLSASPATAVVEAAAEPDGLRTRWPSTTTVERLIQGLGLLL